MKIENSFIITATASVPHISNGPNSKVIAYIPLDLPTDHPKHIEVLKRYRREDLAEDRIAFADKNIDACNVTNARYMMWMLAKPKLDAASTAENLAVSGWKSCGCSVYIGNTCIASVEWTSETILPIGAIFKVYAKCEQTKKAIERFRSADGATLQLLNRQHFTERQRNNVQEAAQEIAAILKRYELEFPSVVTVQPKRIH